MKACVQLCNLDHKCMISRDQEAKYFSGQSTGAVEYADCVYAKK